VQLKALGKQKFRSEVRLYVLSSLYLGDFDRCGTGEITPMNGRGWRSSRRGRQQKGDSRTIRRAVKRESSEEKTAKRTAPANGRADGKRPGGR